LETHRYGGKDPSKDKKKGGGDEPGGSGQGLGEDGKFDGKFIRAYVKHAKSFEPQIPRSLEEKIVLRYVDMRKAEREESADNRKDYITPRQLLGMIRLSQALARLRFAKVVDERDWEEAIRLTDASKASVVIDADEADAQADRETFAREMQLNEDEDLLDANAVDEKKMLEEMDGRMGERVDGMDDAGREDGDHMAAIWDIMRADFGAAGTGVPIFITELKKSVTKKGFNAAQFKETIDFYLGMGVVEYTDNTQNAVRAAGDL